MKPPVRTFHPEVRLKKLMAEGRGITAEQALRRADEGVLSIKDKCLEAIDKKIERLLVLGRSTDADAVDQCYQLSNEVYAEAGAFKLLELSAAAHSLCSLLATVEEGHVPPAAISVHVDAMRALRRPEVAGNEAMRKAVIGELRALAARFAAPVKAGQSA